MKNVKTEDVKLHLMGMGSELNQIKEKIASDNLADKVIYEGAYPIEKAEAYYMNADALVVSLKNEGYVGKTIPNKAIQYMKYGRPLLVVAKGDTYDVLSKANGSIFASEDPKEIAKAIDEICNSKEKDLLGLNNKKYFEENFTTEKLTHLLFDELMLAKK
jgi:glycosyltransferase involved in cell wall biosynthesis